MLEPIVEAAIVRAMTDEPNLAAAYALETLDDNRTLYANWADTYDTDFVATHGYVLPQNVCVAFCSAGGVGPVLDVGAGTGICGALLTDQGMQDVDGMDLSPEMLTIARGKGVYRNLIEADILKGIDRPDAFYGGVVSAGTFTHGHVGPEALDEILRLLRPGGLAVLSINAAHFQSLGFADAFARLAPQMTDAKFPESRIYTNGGQGNHSDDLAVLAQFRKG
ncbi:MAG: class I SAM-dependent methyltransferase [Paracoccaceae bacterium]